MSIVSIISTIIFFILSLSLSQIFKKQNTCRVSSSRYPSFILMKLHTSLGRKRHMRSMYSSITSGSRLTCLSGLMALPLDSLSINKDACIEQRRMYRTKTNVHNVQSHAARAVFTKSATDCKTILQKCSWIPVKGGVIFNTASFASSFFDLHSICWRMYSGSYILTNR